MPWMIIAEALKALGGLIAVLSFPFALWTYRNSVKTRRAEWLASLHEKFFERDRYKDIRRVLDYRSEPEYSNLVRAIADGTHHLLVERMQTQRVAQSAKGQDLDAFLAAGAPIFDNVKTEQR